MLNKTLLAGLSRSISAAEDRDVRLTRADSLGGGDSNRVYCITGDGRRYVVKINHAGHNRNFSAETVNLKVLEASMALRVPRVIRCGRLGPEPPGGGDLEVNFLIMEYIAMRDFSEDESWRCLGRRLAQLHRQSTALSYGWPEDNFIGNSPQSNRLEASWGDFFAYHRIAPQIERANRQNAGLPSADRIAEWVKACLEGHQPEASLLHGDLWNGNVGFTPDGEPIVFDPASYYGDRETDLAMASLFGGFPPEFYSAYQAQWPLSDGFQQRQDLYQLYHLLNHYNLFGGQYLRRAQNILQRLEKPFS